MHTPLSSPSPPAVNDSVRAAAARYRRARRLEAVGIATSAAQQPRAMECIMDQLQYNAQTCSATIGPLCVE